MAQVVRSDGLLDTGRGQGSGQRAAGLAAEVGDGNRLSATESDERPVPEVRGGPFRCPSGISTDDPSERRCKVCTLAWTRSFRARHLAPSA